MLASTRFWAALLTSLIAAAVTSVGVFAVSRHERWGERQAALFISFAAGVLITTAFVHILPEALDTNDAAPLYFLSGFLLIHVANRLLHIYACHHDDCRGEVKGIVPALGIGFHSLVDGVIYAVTFSVSIFTGVLTAIGMVLHELPEGMITYVLLEQGDTPPRRARLYALGLAAFTTPLGLLLAYPFISRIAPSTLGAFLAMAGGVLAYVGATHLLPIVEESSAVATLFTLTAGIAVGILLLVFGG